MSTDKKSPNEDTSAMRSIMNAITPIQSLFESNEHDWIEEQVAAMREGRLRDVDQPNLIKYLVEMNINTQHEIGSKFAVLLQHLLKVMIQPDKHSRNWNGTIVREQTELTRLLHRNPGLQQHVPRLYADAYEDAVRYAVAETGIPPERFPATNPWTPEQALTMPLTEPPAHPNSARKTRRRK